MSWPIVFGLTLAYWLFLFVRMRIRGRRAFDRAAREAAAAHPDRATFPVTLGIEIRPLRAAVAVLSVPIILVIIHLVIAPRAV